MGEPTPTPPLTAAQWVILGAVIALFLAVVVPVAAWSLHALWSWGFAWAR